MKNGQLVFGERMFSKKCKEGSIKIVNVKSTNYLSAECEVDVEGGGPQQYAINMLKLDGSLQITIPKLPSQPKSPQNDSECCNICTIM